MRLWRNKLFSAFLLAIVVFFAAATPSYAQLCEFINVSPTTVSPGDEVQVFFQGVGNNPLSSSQVVYINVDGNRVFTLDCTEVDCSNRVNITNLNTSGWAENTSVDLDITHIIAGIGQCTTTESVSVVPADVVDDVCSPPGLVTVSPTDGDESDTFRFTGCLGVFNSGANPGVVFSNNSFQTSEERQLSSGDIQDDGSFSITQSQFSVGVWEASLYTNQTPQGATLEFNVDVGDSLCTTSAVCTEDGNTGSQECTGVTRAGVCEYDQDSCGPCLYCGDNTCSAGESQQSCPADCAPDTECGNNTCEFGETPQSCPADCDLGNDGEEVIIEQNLDGDGAAIAEYDYCNQVPAGSQRTKCNTCVGKGEEGEHVYTAVGCIRTGGYGLTEDLIRLLMGVSGGVALISILAGAFLFTTSQGDSSKLKEAKGLITAAVSGLFFIVFSIFILQFLGVSILRIPGLG